MRIEWEGFRKIAEAEGLSKEQQNVICKCGHELKAHDNGPCSVCGCPYFSLAGPNHCLSVLYRPVEAAKND